jgi:hypothetical protein
VGRFSEDFSSCCGNRELRVLDGDVAYVQPSLRTNVVEEALHAAHVFELEVVAVLEKVSKGINARAFAGGVALEQK